MSEAGVSLSRLIGQLVAALYLRPWVDEPEECHELMMEIVCRARRQASLPQPILDLLDHADWAVRRDAAEILGWVGNQEATEPLLARLWRDRSGAVRGSIALALQRIGTPEALAAHQEYSRMIRSYPEILGQVMDLAERKGVTVDKLYQAAPCRQARGLCVQDSVDAGQGNVLSFDLCDLLAVVGPPARKAQWCCRNVECTGEFAGELHAISDRGLIVSGGTLAHIALLLDQTVEGEFLALAEDGEAWLVIRAVDSSWFEIWSHRSPVLEQIKAHFHDTRDAEFG